MSTHAPVIGRYAPSPTGALHLGNLQTALAAWLHARLHNGQFLLRIDDLDTQRVVQGSADQIIDDLAWLGLNWDGEVVYQSQRLHRYKAAFQQLLAQEALYPCFCSRKIVRAAQEALGHSNKEQGAIYPQTCRNLTPTEQQQAAQSKTPAYRLKTLAGDATQDDVVVKRADGIYAYQLAAAVDDAAQGITHVVRGQDLASSQAYQTTLMQRLAAKEAGQKTPLPEYLHVPLVVDEQGQKLSKRDGSDSVASFKSRGLSAANLVAQIAHNLKLIKPKVKSISAQELLEKLAKERENRLDNQSGLNFF